MTALLLQTKELTKSYPGVAALSKLNFDVRPGEIHAICGENGAGKSTLIKMLSGAVRADSGQMLFEGSILEDNTPQKARSLGISVIYQEFTLVPGLTVAENIFLGKHVGNALWYDRNKVFHEARKVLDNIGIDIDPHFEVRHLSIAYQQLVEIAKAVSSNVKLLIMDEPTATLTNSEIRSLFELIRRLQKQGVSIIYVSHRLEEIFELSDRITVLRDGTHISTLNTSETDQNELIRLMVGRSIEQIYIRHENDPSDVLLEVSGLSNRKIKNLNFNVRRGEIVGFAGLVGSGRTEMARALFGADAITDGKVVLNGRKIKVRSPYDAIRQGIGFIPEDRKAQGLHIEHSVRVNMTLPSLRNRFSKGLWIQTEQEKQTVEEYVVKLRIKTPSIHQNAKNLSGGNQQKIVISKWLATRSEVLIFDEPTRGVDVGAKREIYELMMMLVAEGKGVIVISSDMPEIMGIADRIYVMHEGQIAGCLSESEASQERILALASGQTLAEGVQQ